MENVSSISVEAVCLRVTGTTAQMVSSENNFYWRVKLISLSLKYLTVSSTNKLCLATVLYIKS